MKAYIRANMKTKHTQRQSIQAYKNHIFLQIRCTFSVRMALKSKSKPEKKPLKANLRSFKR